ncbi:MAG TPA: peptidylprolyl isomerase [Vicinamibacterales bacterium]|nr:peptidylprolyl isomerase [Vicinamibacterales bacterium]
MHFLATLLVALAAALPSQAPGRPTARTATAPFKTSMTIAQMTGKQAVIETALGSFVVDLRPDLAPNHVGYFMKLAGDGADNGTIFHRVVREGIVQGGDPLTRDRSNQAARNLLQLARAGVFDGTSFHRVVQGFVVQTGALSSRAAPLTERQQTLVHRIVSMARGDDPASATTSFFIVTADAPSLDGKYTAFGRVIDGLDVLDRIESTPVSGESPTTRIDLIRVRLVG